MGSFTAAILVALAAARLAGRALRQRVLSCTGVTGTKKWPRYTVLWHLRLDAMGTLEMRLSLTSLASLALLVSVGTIASTSAPRQQGREGVKDSQAPVNTSVVSGSGSNAAIAAPGRAISIGTARPTS
jgi:hypothetical protein